jgi:hypothetical protein
MRLDLTIPDSTSPSLKAHIVALLDRIHDEPEFAEDIVLDDYDNHAGVELTPEQIAIIARAEADIDAGNGLTMEQVRAELEANRLAWQLANLR